MDKSMNELLKSIKVRDWYCSVYPWDNLGKEISSRISFLTIYKALESGDDIYAVMGVGDSCIRETIFDKLSVLLDVNYEFVYRMWLDNTKIDRSWY